MATICPQRRHGIWSQVSFTAISYAEFSTRDIPSLKNHNKTLTSQKIFKLLRIIKWLHRINPPGSTQKSLHTLRNPSPIESHTPHPLKIKTTNLLKVTTSQTLRTARSASPTPPRDLRTLASDSQNIAIEPRE